jgi:hypothetical protein
MKVHGNNLLQKEQHTTKYISAESKKLLAEIRQAYKGWEEANEKLIGPLENEERWIAL